MILHGVLATPGPAHAHAARLTDDLPAALAERFPGIDWRTDVVETPPARASASTWELIEGIRRRALASDRDLAVGLTDLPLHVGRRPVSATHGVGLVSVPALGGLRVDRRLRHAVLRLVGGLVGDRDGNGAAIPDRPPPRGGRIAPRPRARPR